MKDEELREKVNELVADIKKLGGRVVKLEGVALSILPCPQCKHGTAHQFWPHRKWFGGHSYVINNQTEDFYRCLNCGGDWVYGTKTEGTKYEPPKPKSI